MKDLQFLVKDSEDQIFDKIASFYHSRNKSFKVLCQISKTINNYKDRIAWQPKNRRSKLLGAYTRFILIL